MQYLTQVALYGLNAYGFCLEGTHKQIKTFNDLAQSIKNYFSMDVPQNKEVVRVLLSYKDTKIIYIYNAWNLL